jgi:hypothetical protein
VALIAEVLWSQNLALTQAPLAISLGRPYAINGYQSCIDAIYQRWTNPNQIIHCADYFAGLARFALGLGSMADFGTANKRSGQFVERLKLRLRLLLAALGLWLCRDHRLAHLISSIRVHGVMIGVAADNPANALCVQRAIHN